MPWKNPTPEQRARKNAKARERRKKLLEAGICPECGKVELEPGQKLCLDCRINMRERGRKHDKKRRAITSARSKAIREGYYAKGLCYQCGKAPHLEGKKYCRSCLNKQAIRSKKAWRLKVQRGEAIPIETRHYLGICTFCNEPVIPGHKVCAKHLESARKSAENARRIFRDSEQYKEFHDYHYKYLFPQHYSGGKRVKLEAK